MWFYQRLLGKLFAENRVRKPNKIEKLMKIGEYKKDPGAVRFYTAALMQTIQLIYNMEEALIRV